MPSPTTLPGLVAATTQRDPAAVAMVDDTGRLTRAELTDQIGRCAAGLRRAGVRPGSTVGLLCTNRAEWVVSALGAMTAGAQVAAFTTWARQWDLDHLLEHSGCDVLISVDAVGDADLVPMLAELLPEAFAAPDRSWSSVRYPRLSALVLLGDKTNTPGVTPFAELLVDGDEKGPFDPVDPESTAMVLYTSGSTARPKAVQLRHDHAVAHAEQVAERMGVTEADRVLVPVPLFWSYGGANALVVCLATGATVVLQETFDAGRALTAIQEQGCTAVYTLPNITQALLEHPDFHPERVATLRRGMTIGPLRDVRAAAEDLGVTDVCNAYGSTEMYGGAAVTPHDWPLERRLASQGTPLPGMTVTVRDPATGEVLPAGQAGELTVVGHVTSGYLGQPDATSAAFTADGAFRTGDLGLVDETGELHFIGRASDMIRIGGINVSPLEVEDFLGQHDAVEEVLVVGTDDPGRGQVAIAFVTTAVAPDEPARRALEKTLLAHCRGQMAAYKVPARIVVGINELPRTPTGKLTRSPLADAAARAWAEAGSR